MADIVRIEENGVGKYIETHVEAVVGLKELVTVPDTGWVSVAFKNGLSSNFSVRKIGDLVMFSGTAYDINTIADGTVIATLPSAFRPKKTTPALGLGATSRIAAVVHLLYIETNGDLKLVTVGADRAAHINLSNIMYTTL